MATTSKRGGPRVGAGRPKGAEKTRVVRLPEPVAAFARRLAERRANPSNVGEVFELEARSALAVPLMSASVACGFPSPAEDYMERPLDFNELLVANPAATFAVRIIGDSMTGAGIFPGDIAVVDRALSPSNGSLIVACVDREMNLKRYQLRAGVVTLVAENPAYPPLVITEAHEFEVWGVVTNTIRRFKP